MRLPKTNSFAQIEPLLEHVSKPARYLGHEWGLEEIEPEAFSLCMVFPDVYEIGLV